MTSCADQVLQVGPKKPTGKETNTQAVKDMRLSAMESHEFSGYKSLQLRPLCGTCSIKDFSYSPTVPAGATTYHNQLVQSSSLNFFVNAGFTTVLSKPNCNKLLYNTSLFILLPPDPRMPKFNYIMPRLSHKCAFCLSLYFSYWYSGKVIAFLFIEKTRQLSQVLKCQKSDDSLEYSIMLIGSWFLINFRCNNPPGGRANDIFKDGGIGASGDQQLLSVQQQQQGQTASPFGSPRRSKKCVDVAVKTSSNIFAGDTDAVDGNGNISKARCASPLLSLDTKQRLFGSADGDKSPKKTISDTYRSNIFRSSENGHCVQEKALSNGGDQN
uniref:Uncharacterized protein n=1 Tax=Romanomermis culicivorax TaxID=13658 RepID=A0A915KFX1_ROMCU